MMRMAGRSTTLAARLPGETDIDVKGTLPAGRRPRLRRRFHAERQKPVAPPALGGALARRCRCGRRAEFLAAERHDADAGAARLPRGQGARWATAPSPSIWRRITARTRSFCSRCKATASICAASTRPGQAKPRAQARPHPPRMASRRSDRGQDPNRPSRCARPASPTSCKRCSRPTSPMSVC